MPPQLAIAFLQPVRPLHAPPVRARRQPKHGMPQEKGKARPRASCALRGPLLPKQKKRKPGGEAGLNNYDVKDGS